MSEHARPVNQRATRRRLVVGITGASGVIYGIRLLERLVNRDDVESHLIVSRAGTATINHETDRTVAEIEELADVVHRFGNIGASVASGSFRTMGMIVAPCSIKTLSAIANSYSNDLISRAADVALKEGRPVVLGVRESPLHLGHLRLMERATMMGATIAPPVPAFYQRPTTLDEVINHTVSRLLQRVGLEDDQGCEWQGLAAKD